MHILADIGGTHARFGIRNDSNLISPKTYKSTDYKSLPDALEAYRITQGLPHQRGTLSIASAAQPDKQNRLHFLNNNPWIIDSEDLKKSGWVVNVIMNDFEAATWGLRTLPQNNKEILHHGIKNLQNPQCLIGPGTGLGLSYLIPLHDKKEHVQKTYGGHMMATIQTEEQRSVINALQKMKTDHTIAVFENVVSGPGLMNIYKALCTIHDKPCELNKPEELLDQASNPQVKNALRLFHEFLGLFCRTAVVTGNAYGGVYLTGGVLDRLQEHHAFDSETIRHFFTLPGVPAVQQDLENTPFVFITHPYPVLHGLNTFLDNHA